MLPFNMCVDIVRTNTQAPSAIKIPPDSCRIAAAPNQLMAIQMSQQASAVTTGTKDR